MRLIDADALIRELMSIKVTFGSGNGLVEGGIEIAISTTNAQPTVDAVEHAVERKKGKWVGGQCSECGGDVPAYIIDWRWQKDMDAKFCPMCGAEMETDEPSNLEDSRQ